MLSCHLRLRTLKCLSFQRQLTKTVARKQVDVFEQKKHEMEQLKEIESRIPIERRSLSRGLTLNRFEKDFLIYPEYADMDDAERIKERVKKIDSELKASLLIENTEKVGTLTSAVMSTLMNNKIYTINLHKEYGGENLCYKDMVVINEALGQDLSVFMTVHNVHLAANIIATYGSEEQRARYLPKIASLQCKPAICIHDDLESETIASFTSSLVRGELSGTKANVINGKNANLYIIMAKNKFIQKDAPHSHCWYLIDLLEIGSEKITVIDQHETVGLKALNISKLKFTNVSVNDLSILGTNESVEDIFTTALSGDELLHGAAVCGHTKKLLNEMIEYANRRIDGNHRLGESATVRKAVAELSTQVFVLESIVFYLAGLIDEKLILSTDIENAIVGRQIHRTLRQALCTAIDMLGILSTEKGYPYEQRIRNIITYLSLFPAELVHVKNIAVPTIESWLNNNFNKRNEVYKPKLFKRLTFEDIKLKLSNPKLRHYMAEHVHPSLADSCSKLEHLMLRLDMVLNNISEFHGNRITKDSAALWTIASVVENNFATIACIARTNRSYCIGLKNADLELQIAIAHCMKLDEDSNKLCDKMLNVFMLSIQNSEMEIGKTILDSGGYCLESPIEKNW